MTTDQHRLKRHKGIQSASQRQAATPAYCKYWSTAVGQSLQRRQLLTYIHREGSDDCYVNSSAIYSGKLCQLICRIYLHLLLSQHAGNHSDHGIRTKPNLWPTVSNGHLVIYKCALLNVHLSMNRIQLQLVFHVLLFLQRRFISPAQLMWSSCVIRNESDEY